MDFFEQQDRARSNTWKLVLLFILGIVGTLVIVNFICFLGFWFFLEPETMTKSLDTTALPSVIRDFLPAEPVELTYQQSGFYSAWLQWWHSNLNWQVTVGVSLVVLIGTVFRFIELSGGGHKVAEWSGAVPVETATRDPKIKQLIHVCEEMAIAAGMSVPDLYVMKREQGINAFVAGFSVDSSVLVITQGALEQLSRDELQGVVGHEYSHILNGDMRLNIRLMALLAGLVMIGQIGRFLLESGISPARTSFFQSRFNPFTVITGLALMSVGYVGVLVGRIIKAAVSRQREFLADASSVQFTRMPEGLAGALYKIHQLKNGSQLHHRHAEDMSHFCFSESVALSEKLATHPPVMTRIRRISPNFIPRARAKARQEEKVELTVADAPDFQTAIAASSMVALTGTITPDHLNYARSLYRNIPQKINDWVHQSAGAKAFIYGQLVLGSQGRKQGMLNLLKEEDSVSVALLKSMWPTLQQMDEQLRIPVLEIAIPTLKRLPEVERLILCDRLERMILLDGRIDFVEWVVFSLVKKRIIGNQESFGSLSSDIKPFKESIRHLFYAFYKLSSDKDRAELAYKNQCTTMNISLSETEVSETNEFSLLVSALLHLNDVSFIWRKTILQGCADIVQSDNEIAQREYEALRVVAGCLECPLPILMVAPSNRDVRDEPIPFE